MVPSGMQLPPTQCSPLPHVTPVHGSVTHVPFTQTCGEVHVTLAHRSTQVPPTHISLAAQCTFEHGSATQPPAMQSWPGGHVAPVQSSTHAPVASQCVPAPHDELVHAGSRQRPLVASHESPPVQGEHVHDSRQTPASHT